MMELYCAEADLVDTAGLSEVAIRVSTAAARAAGTMPADTAGAITKLVLGVPIAREELRQLGVALATPEASIYDAAAARNQYELSLG